MKVLLYTVHKRGTPRGRILGLNWAKVLRVFLLAIHSHLYSFALIFLFLQTHATSYIFLQTHSTSYNFYSSEFYTLKEKRGKPGRKPYPFHLFEEIHKETSRLRLETSTKLYVHEFGFCLVSFPLSFNVLCLLFL